jgi:hypothetical protein
MPAAGRRNLAQRECGKLAQKSLILKVGLLQFTLPPRHGAVSPAIIEPPHFFCPDFGGGAGKGIGGTPRGEENRYFLGFVWLRLSAV